MWVNGFGEFPRGRQRCAVQLLEPSLLSHTCKQRVQCLGVLKRNVDGIERRDTRWSLGYGGLRIMLLRGNGFRHLDDSYR